MHEDSLYNMGREIIYVKWGRGDSLWHADSVCNMGHGGDLCNIGHGDSLCNMGRETIYLIIMRQGDSP